MPTMKSKRFSRRTDARKATGIGVSKEELDEVRFQAPTVFQQNMSVIQVF